MIMILQQGLILLIPLNAHLTISLNMMWQMFGLVL
jgi:hypothetical protein